MTLPAVPVGPMPVAVQLVADALRAAGHLNEPRPLLPPPTSPTQAAQRLGIATGQIACAALFRRASDGDTLLTVTAADRQVDLHKLDALAGDGRYLPTEDDFVTTAAALSPRALTAVPLEGRPMLIDESLLRFDAVWLAAGDPGWWFGTTPEQLQRWAGGNAVALACDVAPDELANERRLRLLARARAVAASDADMPSPCISVCRIDPMTGHCTGCFRTLGEISRWARSGPDAQRALWWTLAKRAS